jgi:hypothetical protein
MHVNAHDAAYFSAHTFVSEVRHALSLSKSESESLSLACRKKVAADAQSSAGIEEYLLEAPPSWLVDKFRANRSQVLKLLQRRPLPKLEAELESEFIEAQAIQNQTPGGGGGRGKDKLTAGGKRTRKRKKRVAPLLLALLEGDQTKMNCTQSELANELHCNVSAISRAFKDQEYGERLLNLYAEYGVKPPTAKQL